MKLTDSRIRALKPKSERYEVWETNGKGFGVRVSPSGRKTFIFMYRFGGMARRMTIGTYPALTLSEAHEEHAKARQSLEKGKDPGLDSVKGKRMAREAYTVKELVDDYIERHAKRKKRSWKEDDRILRKDVLPRWGNRKAESITKLEIVNLLDDVLARAEAVGGRGVQANRTLEIIRKMFNFAVGRSIVVHNPCAVLEKPAQENKRERVLTEKEIKIFWEKIDGTRMDRGIQLLLKLQLITMQRKGELAQIEKGDIDLKSGWWTQPKEKVKNNQSHRVWITKKAGEIIKEAINLSGESKWFFPGRKKDQHLTPQAVDHALRKAQINDPEKGLVDIFGIARFTPHDLRRTAATHTTGLGIPRFIVGRVLNHVDGSITARYDLNTYDKEKKQTLETWSRKLESIISGKKFGNIVEMKRK